ncbi:hypothetical protein PCANC_26495 [Puccinia coronata f. sp. avenae]|uniref:Uncharacterized protein n=1 Tax=Puccinia coronata f. sp. avenae TaxID=200324 RepID=A0A2N5TJF8_9BASI|nr:hypothetical protein PCANC_26495 [Puccinia coronata f. sp. avenae]
MHSKHAYRTQPTLEYRGLYSNNVGSALHMHSLLECMETLAGDRRGGPKLTWLIKFRIGDWLVTSCENRPAASVFARKGLDPRHEEDDIMTGQQMTVKSSRWITDVFRSAL